jgi:hypothetical protein
LSAVTTQNNSICRHSYVLIANSRFQLHSKHSTIPCTINNLSTILLVLNDGPTEVPQQCQHHIASTSTLLNYLVLGDDMCFHSMLWYLLADS